MDLFILFTGFFKALIIAISFTAIYDFAIKIPVDLLDYVMNSMNTYSTETSTISGTVLAFGRTYPMLGFIKTLFFILYIVLWIQFIKRGLEIFSVLLQIVMLKLALALLLNGNLLFGLAAIYGCLKPPQFLQEFIMSYGGQGIVSKTTQSMYAVNMIRCFVK